MLTGVRGDPISQGTKYSGANQPGAVTAALDSLKKNHRRKGEQWVNTPEARQMGRVEKIGDCTLSSKVYAADRILSAACATVANKKTIMWVMT